MKILFHFHYIKHDSILLAAFILAKHEIPVLQGWRLKVILIELYNTRKTDNKYVSVQELRSTIGHLEFLKTLE